MIAGRGQRRELMPVGVPELGKAMDHEHERPSPSLRIVEANAVHAHVPLSDRIGVDHRYSLLADRTAPAATSRTTPLIRLALSEAKSNALFVMFSGCRGASLDELRSSKTLGRPRLVADCAPSEWMRG